MYSMLNVKRGLDVHDLTDILAIVRPAIRDACAERFGDLPIEEKELAENIEQRILNQFQLSSYRTQSKVRDLVGGDSVFRAGQIKELLKDVPDDRMVLTQIVGAQSGVYNAYLDVGVLKNGDGAVVVSTGHPQLAHLPMCPEDDERQQKIDAMIEQLNALR